MSVLVMNALLNVSASLVYISAGPAPPPLPETPFPKKVILALVADLNSSDFHVRRAATRTLKKSGEEAVVPLAEAAHQGDLEVTTRAIEILETIYASDDLTASEAAEVALERLAKSPNRSVALRAETVLFEYYYQIREPRVIKKIINLGGIVKYNEIFLVDDPKNPEVQRKPIGHIILGTPWKGGNEGIELIKRLKNLQRLYVLQKNGVSLISQKAEQELLKAIPKLVIHHRTAYLGIRSQPTFQGEGVIVGTVQPNTSAARAGMQERDRILLFAGKPVREFDDLIKLIKQTNPGDKVDVVIHRGTKQLTLSVVMGELGVEVKPKK